MNELIEKLYDQALVLTGNGDYVAGELDPAKFAELIVRECAGLFEIEWGDEKLTGNDVGYVVKKHFGVN